MVRKHDSVLARARTHLEHLRAGPKNWVLLLCNRLVLAGAVTAGFGAVVAALVWTDVVALDGPGEFAGMFAALVTGNLTLLTIVLSINQLILSREFNAPDELRDRIQGVVAFRQAVEETTAEATAPVTPAAFLQRQLDGIGEVAQSLRHAGEASAPGATPGERDDGERERTERDASSADQTASESDTAASSSDGDADDEANGSYAGATDVRTEVDHLVDGVLERTERSRQRLERSRGNVFSALVVVLEVNFSQLLRDARRIEVVYEDELDEAAAGQLAELVRALQHADVARQYFKSIYMQAELARLSRLLLWVGLPAVGGALCLLLVYASLAEGETPPAAIRALVPIVGVLNVVPLAVLFAFVLRISAVAERTVAITPFTTVPEEPVVED